jgi:NAD(P)-dependent dehydrogenase (short-subunit alcohol dehydrogenase family)
MDLFSLEGKVALVTGAGRGIGRGIAEGLSSYGAAVLAASRTRSELDSLVERLTGAKRDAMAVEMDVSDLESVRRGIQAAIDSFGRIDILVNNAGMNRREHFMKVSEEAYDRIMSVNLKGLFFTTQEAVKYMIPRRRGKIINIGSLTSGRALGNVSVYASTKGAVGQLTKSQALELAQHNIQVNAICPGFVVTSLGKSMWENPKFREWAQKRLPAGRLATPEDMIGTAIFLASDASDYVTGQLIYVDGGYMCGEPWPADPPVS